VSVSGGRPQYNDGHKQYWRKASNSAKNVSHY
jgi:hypothetical protein